MRTVLLAVLLVSGCGTPETDADETQPAAAPSQDPSVLDPRALREDARWILEAHCGQCHLPDGDRSLSAALAVFDLSTPEWAATMTDAQLEDAVTRLASDLTPDGEPLAVPEADQLRFRAYVDYALAAR